MGHRHVFNPSYMFETDNDQGWNLIECPYALTAETGSSSLAYPANNMSVDGEQCNNNPAPVSNDAYPSLAQTVQNLHYQQHTSGPLNIPTGQENYGNVASSSNHNACPLQDNNDNGRWQYKPKTPADNSNILYNIYDNNNTNDDDDDDEDEDEDDEDDDDDDDDDNSNSNNNINNNNNSTDNVGSLSDICIPTDQNLDIFHTRWDYHNMKRCHEGESSVRNVRSRPNSFSNDYYSTSRPVDVTSNGSTREWNPTHMSSSSSSSLQSHDLNNFINGSSSSGENGMITRGNNNVQSSQVHSFRRPQKNYIQRSSGVHLDEGLQLGTESYSSPRVRSTIVSRSSDRNVRARISYDRYHSFSDGARFHDQHMSEGLMIMDRSAFGSRNPFDYHRDMRLDIDDMSYEDLLALGERIGSVSTGLSDNLISKCLRESVFCCSDQGKDEGRCVICLEEYANMDNVGMLKGCKHDFHVGCIKKWLSMKNLCPICKSEPIKQK